MKKTVFVMAALMIIMCCVSGGMADSYSSVPRSSVWYTYDTSLHWFYAQLSYDEKCAFSARYDALALGDMSQWDIAGFGLTDYQQERVKFVINNDCPELMICTPVRKIADFYALLGSPDWFIEYSRDLEGELRACLKELDRVKSSGSWSGSDRNKQKAYDRNIARTTKYLLDNDGPEGSLHLESSVRSAISAIVNRTAVCEGYSRSTQLAMRYYGIPCIYIVGKIPGGANHAWNLLRVDGSWKHYDAAWNADGDYMNLSDTEMYIQNGRSIGDEYASLGFSLPSCW